MLENIKKVVYELKEKIRSDEQALAQAVDQAMAMSGYNAQAANNCQNIYIPYPQQNPWLQPVNTSIPQFFPSIPQSTKVDLDFCVDMIMAAVQKSFQEQLPDIIREVVTQEIKKALAAQKV